MIEVLDVSMNNGIYSFLIKHKLPKEIIAFWIRSLIYLILVVSTNSFCFSQNNLSNPKNKCYSDKIRLNIKNNGYKDTLILVRNYLGKLDEKRIMCNNQIVDRDIDKLIYECKYLKNYLTNQNKMNKFSIISYSFDDQKNIIAYYFLSDRKTKETVEMVRFKIANKKIIGINVLPMTYEGFVPIDEFDNQEIYIVD